jgi:hypothetical protein
MVAAARLYFDNQSADLTLAEAAMLAGLIRAPSDLNPQRHIKAAQARAATVIDAMVANHAIDAQTAKAAKAEPAIVKSSPLQVPAGSWFTDWVAKRAAELARPQTGIVHVRTTLVPAMQRLSQQSLNEALARNGRSRPSVWCACIRGVPALAPPNVTTVVRPSVRPAPCALAAWSTMPNTSTCLCFTLATSAFSVSSKGREETTTTKPSDMCHPIAAARRRRD